MKRAYKYRFYPTDVQTAQLSRTFGCVRLVYNKALAARPQVWDQRRERVGYSATSAMLTGWKKSRASAEYTPSAFRYRDGRLTLAKMSEPLESVWSRPLPEGGQPSMVTVSRDAAGRWFVSIRNLIKNRAPSRAISDASWTRSRSMLEYKASWYGRELVVVGRFFPSTRMCSTPGCGHVRARLPLNERTWECERCGVTHDRDVNATINLKAAGRSAWKQEGHGATRDGAESSNHREVVAEILVL